MRKLSKIAQEYTRSDWDTSKMKYGEVLRFEDGSSIERMKRGFAKKSPPKGK